MYSMWRRLIKKKHKLSKATQPTSSMQSTLVLVGMMMVLLQSVVRASFVNKPPQTLRMMTTTDGKKGKLLVLGGTGAIRRLMKFLCLIILVYLSCLSFHRFSGTDNSKTSGTRGLFRHFCFTTRCASQYSIHFYKYRLSKGRCPRKGNDCEYSQ